MKIVIFEGEEAHETEFEGYYCTRSGKVVTIKVKGGRGKVDYNNPRLHHHSTDNDGYKQVCLSVNGKHYYRRVHRLVWETFNGKIPDGLTIDHINHIRDDNRLENLRLMTRIENGVNRNTKHNENCKTHYHTFVDGMYVGTFNYVELEKLFKLNKLNVLGYMKGKNVRRIEKLKITLERV